MAARSAGVVGDRGWPAQSRGSCRRNGLSACSSC